MFDEDFIQRTALAWNLSTKQVNKILQQNYTKSIRINTIKQKKSTLLNIKKLLPKNCLVPIEWSNNCYQVKGVKDFSSLDKIFASGQCMLQNASSYIPVLELKPTSNDKILDMCAAPGAKSSHIAMLANNKAILTLNDTSKTRFFNMRKLMNLYNVKADYSLRDGRTLTKYYPKQYFNKILLDAPCSGEANLTSTGSWSLASIKRLHKVQTSLLSQAYELLAPNGRLVYSTCTMAPEENELVINNLLEQVPTAQIVPTNSYPIPSLQGLITWKNKNMLKPLQQTLRLLPGEYTKPFYIAVITKDLSMPEDNSYTKLAQKYSNY